MEDLQTLPILQAKQVPCSPFLSGCLILLYMVQVVQTGAGSRPLRL